MEDGIYTFGKGKGKPIEVFIGMTKSNKLEILIPYSMVSERFEEVNANAIEKMQSYHFVSPAHFKTLEEFLAFAKMDDKNCGIYKINKKYESDEAKYHVNGNIVLEKKYFEMSRRFYRLIKMAGDELRGSVIAIDWTTIPDTKIVDGLSIFLLDKSKGSHYQDWVRVTDEYTEHEDEIERRYLKRYVRAILEVKTSGDDQCRLLVVKKSLLSQDMDRTKEALKQILPDDIYEGMQMDISSRMYDELEVIRKKKVPFNIYAITSLIPLYHALCSDVTGKEPTYRRMLDVFGMKLEDTEMVDVLENNAVHLLILMDCILSSTFIDYQKMIQFPEPTKVSGTAESLDEYNEDQDDDEVGVCLASAITLTPNQKMENYL